MIMLRIFDLSVAGKRASGINPTVRFALDCWQLNIYPQDTINIVILIALNNIIIIII